MLNRLHATGIRLTIDDYGTGHSSPRLTALGCHFLQGYHLSKPVPADELFMLLAATSALVKRMDPRELLG